ncbi:MAG: 4Fe-4S ferredoxin [Rectinema sp.]
MHAARNLRLCTKDCICLFVCPTKATDTENGQVDFSKCLDGCRLCVDACPSHAIYLVNANYAEPAPKARRVSEKAFALLDRKAGEEAMVKQMLVNAAVPGKDAANTANASAALVLKALEKSLRIVAEDAAREAAYMLPQSSSTQMLIETLLQDRPKCGEGQFPEQELRELKGLLSRT